MTATLGILSHNAKEKECCFAQYQKHHYVRSLNLAMLHFSYTVQPDGSVTNIELITSDKYGMWNESAKSALSQWKYAAIAEPVRKEESFTFVFEE